MLEYFISKLNKTIFRTPGIEYLKKNNLTKKSKYLNFG